jgi:hypothetical protein
MHFVAEVLFFMRKAIVAFFCHDLTIRRSEQGLRLVLQAPRAPATTTGAARGQARLDQERGELQLMLEELDALLDQQPDACQTMHHLDSVRQALHKKGLRALRKLPLDQLQRALEQFESLVSNWSPAGLASLRSKMAVTIADRARADEAFMGTQHTRAALDSLPATPALPEVHVRSDDEALAAAYAAVVAETAATPETAAGAATTTPAETAGTTTTTATPAEAVASLPWPGEPVPAQPELVSQSAKVAASREACSA